MLDIFDVIHEAHSKQGHLKVDKTLANCTMFYSPTYKLCKLFITDCFICHERYPKVPARKGAKKPILPSEFHNCFQVDLIDMRTMRKKGCVWSDAALDHDSERPFNWAGVSLCATMEEGHVCCGGVGEVFWFCWSSRNLSHWCVYHFINPIS
jgi:hypothetical protein